MNREKQIEEMIDDLLNCYCEFESGGDIYTDYPKTAERMIEKGWRKQNDIIKEFAEKLKSHLYDNPSMFTQQRYIVVDEIDSLLEEMKGNSRRLADEVCWLSEKLGRLYDELTEVKNERDEARRDCGMAQRNYMESAEAVNYLHIQLDAMRTAANSYKMHYEKQKVEIEALTNAVDNSTKEFLKLHDKYQEQKAEIDKWMGRCRDWHEVAEEKSKLVGEIFEEIDELIFHHGRGDLADKYFYLAMGELKKKYTDEERK